MGDPGATDVCFQLVRTHDPDRYLTALLAPRAQRRALMTLFAFHAELARIPDLVSEPSLGEIRLQWWRDVLAGGSRSNQTGGPVAEALKNAVTHYRLPKPGLIGMIDARSADLDGGGFADFQAFRAYLYKCHGALFALSARILGVDGRDIVQVSNPAAVCYGIVRILTALPRDGAAGRVMLPLSLIRDHGFTPENLLAGEEVPGIHAAIAELAGEARMALDETRPLVDRLASDGRAAFAALAVVDPLLLALERPGVRPLHDVAEINPLVRFMKVWRASRTGRF